jgi:protoheme IX farnesyltransferase
MQSSTETLSFSTRIVAKARAYGELLKFRLSLLVAFSAVFGYAMAAPSASWSDLFWIGLGGLLVTGAANTLNQITEREYDALMKRTAIRPLPTSRLNTVEALVFAILTAFAGIWVIGSHFNLPASLLSIISLLLYAFVYTPLKRFTPFCVFVGAIPGGLPPLIGWVAFTGQIDTPGLLLFAFQFFWQFPHFWAIAWLAHEDYTKAGFKMMPSATGKTRFSTWMILLYAATLVPLAVFPWQAGMISGIGAIALAVSGALFCIPAIRLHRSLDGKFARQLMFSSFAYLPVIQAIFVITKQ